MTPTISSLAPLLDRRTLRRMAGPRSFERGEDYFANGQVGSLVDNEGTVAAKVRGTQPYRVKLWVEGSELEYSCTCPVGNDGAFCKHCVAVGLAWVEQGKVADTKGRKRPKATLTTDDVRVHLEEQSKDALVDILMEHAVGDDRLRQRLLMKAARRAPRRVGLATYRQAIDEAVDVGGFVDYRGASSWQDVCARDKTAAAAPSHCRVHPRTLAPSGAPSHLAPSHRCQCVVA